MTQPLFECVQQVVEGDVVPFAGVNLVVAYVGKAVDEVGAEGVVDGIREAAPVTFPVLGPVRVVADQFVCKA